MAKPRRNLTREFKVEAVRRITAEGKGLSEVARELDLGESLFEERFDDLTGTVFANHHQPLRAWITCLYLTGLNLSGLQIARELAIDTGDARAMVSTLRQGIFDRTPPEQLSGESECAEVYVVAGHKGHPEALNKKGEWAEGDA